MTIKTPPKYIASIINHLASEGHECYFVGGSVRDAVMNRPVHDWDLATSAAPVDVARLFPKTVLTGEKFGTVTVVLPECSVEVTTFRTDGDYIDGRRPEEVKFVTNLEEDLSRRDFTMNAMAATVDGELIDPFGGLEDINAGSIKCVGGPNTRFSEDALRMFRALRFSAELGFKIETETMQAIYANTGLAGRISSERICAELEKTLMSEKPQIAGEMIKIGLLEKYMTHSGKAPDGLEKIALLPAETVIRWYAFCKMLQENEYIRAASDLLHSLHLDGKTIKTCLRALEIEDFPDDDISIKRLLSKNDELTVRCAAAVSDIYRQRDSLKLVETIISSGDCVTLENLAVHGRDLLELGHNPGKELGQTLQTLLDHVIEHPGENTREALIKLLNNP